MASLFTMADGHLKRTLLHIVKQASTALILPVFNGGIDEADIRFKANKDIVTSTDIIMQEKIVNGLKQHWPDIPVLGEELTPREQRSILDAKERPFWVLDPIDGTSNFAFGIPYFCTSLALIYRGEVYLGLTYDPIRDECFLAMAGCGATLNHQQLNSGSTRDSAHISAVMALVDFKRLPQTLASKLAANPPYRSQRSFGASALDWCWLAANRCQLYLHGSQNLWDYAAGTLILKEAGGASCSFDGNQVFDASLNSRTVIAASRPELFEQWQKHIRECH